MASLLDEFDAVAEIRRRRRIMMGKGEAGTTASAPVIEIAGVTRFWDLFARRVGVPRGAAFAFFAIRILAGTLWLVNGLVKNPWNDWGYFPSWSQKFADHSPIPPYKWFLENVVIPHIDFWGWIQFLLEVGLGLLLLTGLLNGIAGPLATAWGANIVVGSLFVPGEWVWGLASFLAVMVLCWATRSGRYFGMDAFLRSRLAENQHALYRSVARWLM